MNADDYKSFQDSFDVARRYRDGRYLEAIVQRLSVIFASKDQHDKLAERMTNLETMQRVVAKDSHQQPGSPAEPDTAKADKKRLPSYRKRSP
jgi:hypothetical protein